QPESPDVSAKFPFLQGNLRREFDRVAARIDFVPGERLYEEGFPCPFVPFLVSGGVRVFKISDSGREITLYRVRPGQVCILSATCSVLQRQYSVIAESEFHSTLYVVPGGEFRGLLRRFGELQEFVFGVMSERLMEIISLVDDVAFRRIDLRLAERLLRETRPPGKPTVAITHARLAIELGTSREVISRKLKDLERAGVVRMGRGRVELVNRAALEGMSHSLSSVVA
ncbi:MAG TPA: Crp/Fnr family transcriptional regulator, partial [bacterium]|nr:Crp/Fnr family transcriptional regulator [bacterium]